MNLLLQLVHRLVEVLDVEIPIRDSLEQLNLLFLEACNLDLILIDLAGLLDQTLIDLLGVVETFIEDHVLLALLDGALLEIVVLLLLFAHDLLGVLEEVLHINEQTTSALKVSSS